MIKILFACTLAVLLVGCKTTAIAADTRSTDLTFDKALNIQLVDPVTGELAVDAPASTELTSINIDSAAAIFTGDPAQNLGGSFDNDADDNIFKATFGSSFGSLSFGNVAQPSLDETFLLTDLVVSGSRFGSPLGPGDVDLIYFPG